MAASQLTPNHVAQVSELVAGYISAQRKKYAPRAVALSAQQRSLLEPFFAPEVLDNVRVLVLVGERVSNPEFYPMPRGLGLRTCLINLSWALSRSLMLWFHMSPSRMGCSSTNWFMFAADELPNHCATSASTQKCGQDQARPLGKVLGLVRRDNATTLNPLFHKLTDGRPYN